MDDLVAIPEISLTDIIGDRPVYPIIPYVGYIDGQMPLDQVPALLSVLIAKDPKSVLEIGTYIGTTTYLMALNLPSATIFSVDLPDDYDVNADTGVLRKDDHHLINLRQIGTKIKGVDNVRLFRGDTATWDFTEAAAANAFFIDGSHTYDYAKNDSEKCFNLCGGRGLFLWHDCDIYHPGVVKLICEWRSLGRDVKRIAGTPIAYWDSLANRSTPSRPV